jgi:hypothetical protein
LLANFPENGKLRGSLTGISIGDASLGAVTQTQKIWRSFQALGDIAFAYSYSMILIEIQVYFGGGALHGIPEIGYKKGMSYILN